MKSLKATGLAGPVPGSLQFLALPLNFACANSSGLLPARVATTVLQVLDDAGHPTHCKHATGQGAGGMLGAARLGQLLFDLT